MKLGFLGLGKMGSRMVKKLVLDGHEVVAWNRSYEVAEQLKEEIEFYSSSEAQSDESRSSRQAPKAPFQGSNNITITKTVEEAIRLLPSPKIIWLMLPAGSPTENILHEVVGSLSPNDIVIDGGNANWKDTQRRSEELSEKGIRFLGIGVSGGVLAEKNGFPLMVGGNRSAYEEITPLLDTFAYPHGGHVYLGVGGAGHFVKMVHNGIEYGMMQAIGEGFDVMAKSPFNLDLLQVGEIYQKGSIVSSFLIDRAVDALKKDKDLSNMAGPIAENGEAKWTLDAAKEENVAVPVIQDSLQFRWDSQKDETIQNSYTAKMVSALRFEFGGHEIKKK
jgi:6-phosphogluconate dehydrogenase